MKKQLITALAAAALTITMSITAFAGSLTYQITSGTTTPDGFSVGADGAWIQ